MNCKNCDRVDYNTCSGRCVDTNGTPHAGILPKFVYPDDLRRVKTAAAHQHEWLELAHKCDEMRLAAQARTGNDMHPIVLGLATTRDECMRHALEWGKIAMER